MIVIITHYYIKNTPYIHFQSLNFIKIEVQFSRYNSNNTRTV